MQYHGYQKFWAGVVGVALQGVNLYLPQVVEVSAEVTSSSVVILSLITAFVVKQVANK